MRDEYEPSGLCMASACSRRRPETASMIREANSRERVREWILLALIFSVLLMFVGYFCVKSYEGLTWLLAS